MPYYIYASYSFAYVFTFNSQAHFVVQKLFTKRSFYYNNFHP